MTSGTSEQEIVVFKVRRDSQCSECGRELFHGSLLRMENGQPLCMECADLGHLEFLSRGDPAVTRRASKYSTLRAVVVEWSRSRKRYERQGILAEPEAGYPPQAGERAEAESLADAELRERRPGTHEVGVGGGAAGRRGRAVHRRLCPGDPGSVSGLPGRR